MRLTKERREREAAEARRRIVFNYAKSDIEKIVAEDAADKDYDDPWKYLEDVSNHGCASGIVPGLIYYHETCKFYEKHKKEIWAILAEDQESQGEGNILSMLGSLPMGENITDEDTFENNLAWYAYERACQTLLDRKEQGLENGPEDEEEL